MHFDFNEDQRELKRSARRFLEQRVGLSEVRRQAERGGYDPALYQRMAEELAWTGLAIPEAAGGYGFTWVELAAVLEETGRWLTPSPLLSSAGLAAAMIRAVATDAQQAELLPGIVDGSRVMALAACSGEGRWKGLAGAAGRCTTTGDGVRISGTWRAVVDAPAATDLLLLCREGEAVRVVLAPAGAAGLTITELATMDATRRLGAVEADDLSLPASAVLGDTADASAAAQRGLDVGALLVAAELLGVAEACLDMAVDYAKTRVQFGKPIGSFQAIKHLCADMTLHVECARSAVYYAAWLASQPDTSDAALAEAAATAKATASTAAFHNAGQNIQIHGGIGITWEHDAQLYFKRARAAEALLGDALFHEQRVANALFDAAPLP